MVFILLIVGLVSSKGSLVQVCDSLSLDFGKMKTCSEDFVCLTLFKYAKCLCVFLSIYNRWLTFVFSKVPFSSAPFDGWDAIQAKVPQLH